MAPSFLSRLSSGNPLSRKVSSRSASTAPSTAPENESSYLPLDLPSPSLLNHGELAPSTPPPSGKSNRLNGGRDLSASPWVSVGVAGAAQTPQSTRNQRYSEVTLSEAESEGKKRLSRATLGVAEVTVLVQECGRVIRERGLDTLGLFRPFRLAESPVEIRRLALLFLDFVDHRGSQITYDQLANSLYGGNTAAEAKMKQFQRELNYAEIHDVVAVLKWGLRRLEFASPFAGSKATGLAWHRSFTSACAAQSYPRNAFHSILLPQLPSSSQNLLLAVLELIQSVSAFAQRNAMSSRKLARALGIYVFGLVSRDTTWLDWRELYEVWREAGDALHHCLQAYLRTQDELPPRLLDIIDGYPPSHESSSSGVAKSKQLTALAINMQGRGRWDRVERGVVNDQQTGYVDADNLRAPVARRRPLDVLHTALDLAGSYDSQDVGTNRPAFAWATLARRARERDSTAIFSDEFRRVLELVQRERLPALSDDEEALDSEGGVGSTPRLASSSTGLGQPPASPTAPRTSNGGLTHFANQSSNTLSSKNFRASARPGSERLASPSWDDFASSGFANGSSEAIGLASPSELAALDDGSKYKRRRLANGYINSITPPTFELDSSDGVDFVDIDEEFPDVWLDTLIDDGACASWPSFLLAEVDAAPALELPLASDKNRKISFVLISEQLLPPIVPAPPPFVRSASRAPSTAGSSMSRKWTRRASNLFTHLGAGGKGASRRSVSSGLDKADTAGDDNDVTPTATPRMSSYKRMSSFAAGPGEVIERASQMGEKNTGPASDELTRTTSRDSSRSLKRRSMMFFSRSASTTHGGNGTGPAAVPPLPTKFSLESLRAASLSGTDPQPISEPTTSVTQDGRPALTSAVSSSSSAGSSSTTSAGGPKMSIEEAVLATESRAFPAAPLPRDLLDGPPTSSKRDAVAPQSPQSTAKGPSITASVSQKVLASVSALGAAVAGHHKRDSTMTSVSSMTEAEDQREDAGPSTNGKMPAASPALSDNGTPVLHISRTMEPAPESLPIQEEYNNDQHSQPAEVSDSALEVESSGIEPLAGQTSDRAEIFKTQKDVGQNLVTETGSGGVAVHQEPGQDDAPLLEGDLAERARTVEHPQFDEDQNAPVLAAEGSPVISLSPPPAEPRQIEQTANTSEMLDAGSLANEESRSALPPSPPLPSTPLRDGAEVANPSSSKLTPSAHPAKRSPTPSGSSAKSTSKKILGSVGSLLRRKTPAEKEQDRLAKEEKAQLKEEVRLRKLQDEELARGQTVSKPKKVPRPVSSVKQRVQEIEAETSQIGLGLTSASPTGKRTSGSNSSLRRISSVPPAIPLPPAKVISTVEHIVDGHTSVPAQEMSHLDAKAPVSLDELPSAVPRPTETSNGTGILHLSQASTVDDDPLLVKPRTALVPPPFALPEPPAENLTTASHEGMTSLSEIELANIGAKEADLCAPTTPAEKMTALVVSGDPPSTPPNTTALLPETTTPRAPTGLDQRESVASADSSSNKVNSVPFPTSSEEHPAEDDQSEIRKDEEEHQGTTRRVLDSEVSQQASVSETEASFRTADSSGQDGNETISDLNIHE